MNVSLLVIGRTKKLSEPIADYDKRARRYWKMDAVELAAGKGSAASAVRLAEANSIRGRMQAGFKAVALTREGDRRGSGQLADLLESWALASVPGAHFIIGGAFGLDPQLVKECSHTWSLSDLTLPHEVARLILAEQLYRAGTILRNEPYHKGPR